MCFVFVFQRTMAESNPPDTQPEKAASTGRFAKNKLRFKYDSGKMTNFFFLFFFYAHKRKRVFYY